MNEVVSSILGPLAEKIASLAIEEIQLVCAVKDDRENLMSNLKMIQEKLADAEQKQTKDESVRSWLSKLKDFCYDAEDVVDEFEAMALWRRARLSEHLPFKRKVCSLFSRLPNFIFQFKIAHDMKKLRNRLDEISRDRIIFGLSIDASEKTIVPRTKTSSRRSLNVVGRKEETECIIKQLIRSDDVGAGTIAVIPIVGMGGTGKTTLAKLVYHDDRVNEHFKDNKVWLFMPDEFEFEKIIRVIIDSLGHKPEHDTVEALQNCLRSILGNKRYLFVMDDVWKVRKQDWEDLRDFLEEVSQGSKVVLSTRIQETAETMGTVAPINLVDLSPEYSLTLFVKYAFAPGQEKDRPDLMEIGEEMVSKCRGNPLAVKTLGLLLSETKNRKDWEEVKESEMWLKTDILPSLRISYDLMPSYLKKCFAYCSIFPKSHVFSNLDLIQLWISNGLIQSSGNNQEPEEVGRRYLKELVSRSFFDVVHEDYPMLFFRMHDLIYELAISVAETETFNMKERTRHISRTQDIPTKTRHISFPNPSRLPEDVLRRYLSKYRPVRTIMFEEASAGEFFRKKCISRSKRLRVLWLDGSTVDILPSSIGGLKHLRFLTLRGNRNIKNLPQSIFELRNLQYLGLGGCMALDELPASIKNMISLRVLSITTKQQHFPKGGIGCLTSLQWLFIGQCINLEALFDDIQSLTSLRKLFIWDCPKLTTLPQGIKDLEALEHLGIWGCESLKLPEGKGNGLCRLQSFRFERLPEIVSLPGWLEGSASSLEQIIIRDCPQLRELPEWLQNCSSLTTLQMVNCEGLSSVPDGVRRRIAALKMPWISNCGRINHRLGSPYLADLAAGDLLQLGINDGYSVEAEEGCRII